MAKSYVEPAGTLKSFSVSEKQIIQDLDKKLFKATLMIESEAKQQIQSGSRSGRTYKRRSVTHKASAPGEYPKTDTGKLVRNIFSDKVGLLHYIVGSRGSGAPHGRWLQFGTLHMRPRPWLDRAAKSIRGKLQGIFR